VRGLADPMGDYPETVTSTHAMADPRAERAPIDKRHLSFRLNDFARAAGADNTSSTTRPKLEIATREWVSRRSHDRCKYCHLRQKATPLIPFHVEHIVARQHEGSDDADNLALACDRCNAYMGPNLTTIAPNTGEIIPNFNPRNDTWEEHFQFEGARIVGFTKMGQATIRLLNMNAPRRVHLREIRLREGGTL